MNERCKGQRKVCFDVVEAYDQGNHAAGHVLAFLPLPAFDFKNEGGGLASHTVVPTSQWKPNADIELDFDDDLPVTSSSEEEYGAPCRHVPPPDWRNSPELGRAHGDRALSTGTDGHLTIKFTTWFVDHGRHHWHQDSRPLSIRPQIISLLHHKLRKLWQEYLGRRDRIKYVIVTPTPGTLEGEDRTIHIIVEKNRPHQTEWQPILFTLRPIVHGIPQDADRFAILVHQVITREGLQYSLNIGCDPVHMMVPSGRRQGWLQAHEERVVTGGQHIPIWWDLRRRIETPQEEEVALFQLMSTPSWSRKTRLNNDPEEDHLQLSAALADGHQFQVRPPTPEGGTMEENNEGYIDECLDTDGPHGDSEVAIHTYGLMGWHIGTRSGRVERVSRETLSEEVQRLWPEILAPRNILNVHALTRDRAEIHVIVEFFDGRLERHGEQPCLRRTFSFQLESPNIEAFYIPSEVTRNGILYHGGYDDVCKPWQQHKCSVRVDNSILVADDRSQLHTGTLIDIWIYALEEDDAVNFMQRHMETHTPESVEEEQIWTTLHMPEESLPVSLSVGSLTVLEQINKEWNTRIYGHP